MYECKDLRFSYQFGEINFEALKGVDLSIAEGQMLALSGPSGSGKSTLLNLLGFIEPLQKGKLVFGGQNISDLSENEKNRIRRFQIGFIFQQFHLFNFLSAEENVSYFLHKQGIAKKERLEICKKTLTDVGLWSHRDKLPLQMSGGQRQRVAIARAIAKNPKVLIADEPTASLDQKTGKDLMVLLEKINKENGTTVLVTSHDPMVLEFIPLVLKLDDGRMKNATP